MLESTLHFLGLGESLGQSWRQLGLRDNSGKFYDLQNHGGNSYQQQVTGKVLDDAYGQFEKLSDSHAVHHGAVGEVDDQADLAFDQLLIGKGIELPADGFIKVSVNGKNRKTALLSCVYGCSHEWGRFDGMREPPQSIA